MKPTPAKVSPTRARSPGLLEESVYDALAQAKILTSAVAMHLERVWRDKFFWQLDMLHRLDEWEADEQPVRLESIGTFLRAMMAVRPQRHPGLSLGRTGNLIAAWTSGDDRLTLEFRTENSVRAVLAVNEENKVDRAVLDTSAARLPRVLAPYDPSRWFGIRDQ